MEVRCIRKGAALMLMLVVGGFLPLCAWANSLEPNATKVERRLNFSSLAGGEQEQTGIVLEFLGSVLRAGRQARGGEELGSGVLGEEVGPTLDSISGGTASPDSSTISPDSVEQEHLLKVAPNNEVSHLPTLPVPHGPKFQLDFQDEEDREHTDPPRHTTLKSLDMDHQSPTATPARSPARPDAVTVAYLDPGSRRRDLELSSVEPASNELQAGDPTSWKMPEDYDYITPYEESYTTTVAYTEEEPATAAVTTSTEDQDIMRLTTTPPSMPFDPHAVASHVPLSTMPSSEEENEEPPPAPGVAGATNGSHCRQGYMRHNASCKSMCDFFPSYCFNGGQCYLVEGTGVFCRCSVQDYIWHKGSRCESVITEFQVMCIAVAVAALMVLLLLMVTVCFAKQLHILKTENRRLRKRSSKYRPASEQHNDNFSLSTIAEGSHTNKTMNRYTWECKTKEEPGGEDDPNGQNKLEDPVKAQPPNEEESLNIQNSLTPKHENNKVEGEENSSDVNSLQNNMM